MNIIETVKSLNLPTGHYVVFGSAPMAVRGLRESSDIDLLVDKGLFEELRKLGWEETKLPSGDSLLSKDNIEVFDGWNVGGYHPDTEDLISRADMFEEVPFATLADVLEWKEASGRPKDLVDVEILRNFLSEARPL